MAFSPGLVPRPLLIPLPVLIVVIPLSKIPLPFAQMILYGDRTSIVPSIWYTCCQRTLLLCGKIHDLVWFAPVMSIRPESSGNNQFPHRAFRLPIRFAYNQDIS